WEAKRGDLLLFRYCLACGGKYLIRYGTFSELKIIDLSTMEVTASMETPYKLQYSTYVRVVEDMIVVDTEGYTVFHRIPDGKLLYGPNPRQMPTTSWSFSTKTIAISGDKKMYLEWTEPIHLEYITHYF